MIDGSALADENISLAEALMGLHAKDDVGRMHVGVDAFLLIWRQIPRWRVAAVIAASLPVSLIVRAAHPVFASGCLRGLPKRGHFMDTSLWNAGRARSEKRDFGYSILPRRLDRL